MANVANTKHTGPASKDAVAGGKKMVLRPVDGATSRGSLPRMGNSSEEAHRRITSLRVNNNFTDSKPESTIKGFRAPK